MSWPWTLGASARRAWLANDALSSRSPLLAFRRASVLVGLHLFATSGVAAQQSAVPSPTPALRRLQRLASDSVRLDSLRRAVALGDSLERATGPTEVIRELRGLAALRLGRRLLADTALPAACAKVAESVRSLTQAQLDLPGTCDRCPQHPLERDLWDLAVLLTRAGRVVQRCASG